MQALSTQQESTLIAVSCSECRMSSGASAACAGRVTVTALAAMIAAA
jgi:hypothetical protein